MLGSLLSGPLPFDLSPAPAWPGPVLERVGEADLHLLRGDLEAASSALDRAIELLPEDALLLFVRANMSVQRGQLEDAIHRLERVLTLRPEAAHIHNDLGLLYYEARRDLPNAILHLERSIALDPHQMGAEKNLVQVLLAARRPGDALVVCETLLEETPDDVDALLSAARLALDLGKTVSSEERLKHVLRIDSANAAALGLVRELREGIYRPSQECITGDGALITRDRLIAFIKDHFCTHPQHGEYYGTHLDRYAETLLRALPRLTSKARVLDTGSYSGELPVFLWRFAGLTNVRACTLGGDTDAIRFGHGAFRDEGDPKVEISFPLDNVNLEKDRWPYESKSFDTVFCLETLEHLQHHPLHMMAEANRVLSPHGLLILSTPNAQSFYGLTEIVAGRHPNLVPKYMTDRQGVVHAKEYTFTDLEVLCASSGFKILLHQTFSPFTWCPEPRMTGLLETCRQNGMTDAQSGMFHFVIAQQVTEPQYECIEPVYTESRLCIPR